MSVTHPSRRRAKALCVVALIWAAHLSLSQSADAQEATAPAMPILAQVVDAQGMTTTDPNAPLFRRGTSPLVPLTRANGDPITLGDWDNVTGQVHIAARPGGGTDVSYDVQGLFPGELYSAWVGYFQDPGFPSGVRVGFGAVSEAGDGTDNFLVADANGEISLDLVLQEGPMTVQGNAPSYAPISPILSGGVLQPHTGPGFALAYHFNNAPDPPFLNPGPIETWAVQAMGAFAAVPEPSSVALAILTVAGCAVFVRRRRTT
jgi:hypothetical protein